MIKFLKKLFGAVFAPVDRTGKKITALMRSVDYDASEMHDRFYELVEPLLKVSKTEEEKEFMLRMTLFAWNKNLLYSDIDDSQMFRVVLSVAFDQLGTKKTDRKKLKAQWLLLRQRRMNAYSSHRDLILHYGYRVEAGEITDLHLVSVKIPVDWSRSEVERLYAYYHEMRRPAALQKKEIYDFLEAIGAPPSPEIEKVVEWHAESCLEKGQERVRLHALFEAADVKDACEQVSLAFCYEEGKGVAKDERVSAKWLEKAAHQGDKMAQHCLGYCYIQGKGVRKDEALGVSWLQKSADQGYSPAQKGLGYCYAKGVGVPENKEMAVKWYRRAADQGDPDAQFELSCCYGLGEGVARDRQAWMRWLKKAAEQGSEVSQYTLGRCYLTGRWMPKDEEVALSWLKKAADQGSLPAQRALILLRAKKKGRVFMRKALLSFSTLTSPFL